MKDPYFMDYQTRSSEELISEILDQKQEIDSLKIQFNKELNDRKQIEGVLKERLKELSCHDQVAELMSNSAFSIDEVCEKIVLIIPSALQFPEIAEASIQIYDKVFKTPNFERTKNSLQQEIITNQQIIGHIEVCYPVDKTGSNETAFMTEESNLLFSIAVKLGNYIGKEEKEIALRQSEEQYRKLVESVNDVIFDIDATGNIRFISQSVLTVLGYSVEEGIGRNIFSFVYPEDVPVILNAFKNLSTRDYSYMEYRYVRKDGSVRWVRSSTSPIFENGLLTGGRGILTDITERKQKEDQLRKLSQAVEQSPVSIVMTDLEGNIEYANPKATQTTGYTLEELKGKNPRVLKSGETTTDEYQYLWDSISQGNIWRGIFHNKRKNGELYWESSQITPITDENGSITSYLAIKEDITERINIQEELAKSESRFREITEQSQNVIWETDSEAVYTFVNQASEIAWGLKPSDLIGKKRFFDIHPEEGRQEFIDTCLQLIQKGEQFRNLESLVQGDDGKMNWVMTNGMPYFDSDGNVKGYRGSSVNINLQKSALNALKINEDALNQAQEISQICSWELDLIHDNLTWSKNYYHLMGIPAGTEMKTQFFQERVHPDDLHLVKEKVEEMTALRQPVIYDIRLRMPDNEYRWIQNNIVPEFENEKLVRLRGVNIDVTEKKLAEQEIKQQNERLSAIIGAIPDLIIIVDKNGTCLEYYSSTPDRSPIHNEQNVGLNIKDIFDEELAQRYINKVEDCLYQQSLITYEFLGNRDNSFTAFEVRLAPMGTDRVLTFVRDITNEKLKEAEIKKLSLAVEQSPDIIVITDLKGKIEYVNPAFSAITGYLLEEVLGQNPSILKSGQTSQSVYKDLWETIKAGDNWYGEWKDKKKNGEFYWEAVSITPIRDESGKITNYLAIKQDISQRKQAEQEILDLNANLEFRIEQRTEQLANTNKDLLNEIEERKRVEDALSESEKSYRTVVENVNEVIFQTDAKGLWRFLNKSWEVVTGFTVEESLGQSYLNFVHPLDRAGISELTEPLVKREKDYYRHETRYLTKDGGFRWIEVFARLALNDNEEITGTYGTLKDITERKFSEDKLAQMSSRLSLALRVGGIGVWDYDVVNNILLWDNQMFAIYGVRQEDFSSAYEAWLKSLHPDDKIRSDEAIQMAISGEKEFDTEFRVVWADGSVHHVRGLATCQRNNSGSALRLIGINWDITSQKQAADFENEILQLSTKLTGIMGAEIDSALKLALLRIGQFLNADRAYIFEINGTDDTMSNTYEWCNEGIPPEIENLQEIPCNLFPKWMETLLAHGNIIIPSVQDLPESWQSEREMFEPQGIQSLAVIPLLVENNLIGFVGLDSVNSKRDYNSTEMNMLKVWSSMLASLIHNQRTENLMEQTRQNYETFFNTIDDFLWVLDQQGNIIHMNKTVKTRLEYSEEELYHESVLMVFPSTRREEAELIVDEMLAGNSEFSPVPIVTKSGKQIPVETRVKAGFWNGAPVLYGVSKDVSQIQLSEQKFSSAFQSNSSIMTITRFDDDQFVDVNNAFVSTLGYSREEIKGKTLVTLGIVKVNSEEGTIQEAINRGLQVREIEIIAYSKSNNLIILLLSAEEIYIGSERCILSVAVNITERKIMETDLRKARMEADQANLAKSEFLSRMSHELRTPMNSILGFAQLLEMGELTTVQKKGVVHIMKSGKHLLDLINEVLDISRIEAGKISLSLEPVQIGPVIEEMIDIVKLQANERRIKIEFINTPSNQLFVKSDKQRLKQVLLNLLNNAIKYNHEGGSVLINAEIQPANNAGIVMIRIAITDTGLGISAEDLPKLFTPFERIGAEKSLTEGTGLGLTVVEKIIGALGGIINVESVLGEGSVFWFELPYIESQLGSLQKSGGLHGLASNLANKSGTILYIEDNLSNIELVEQILSSQRSGIHLITRIYGKQALDTAIEYRPDIILLDLDLPDIHGREVLKQLKTDEKTMGIPVVIVSANAMPNQIDKFLKEGAVNYLAKPFDIHDFLKVVDEFIVG
jgi:PAS domain S-box-containing protein